MTTLYVANDKATLELNYDLTRERILPRHFLELVDAYAAYHRGELKTHPLIKEVKDFDTTWFASDSALTYNNGEKRLAELDAQIDACKDFNPDEKAALRAGLRLDPTDKFLTMFPYARIAGREDNAPEQVKEYLTHGFDEARYLKVQALLNKMAKPMNRAQLKWFGRVVHTKAAPHPTLVLDCLSVNAELQGHVYNLEQRLTVANIDYYLRWHNTVVHYGKKLYLGEATYHKMSNVETRVTMRRAYAQVLTDRTNPDSAETKPTLELLNGQWPNTTSFQMFINGL